MEKKSLVLGERRLEFVEKEVKGVVRVGRKRKGGVWMVLVLVGKDGKERRYWMNEIVDEVEEEVEKEVEWMG